MQRLVVRRVRLAADAATVFRALYADAPHAFWLDSSDASGWSYLGSASHAHVSGTGDAFDRDVFGTLAERLDAHDVDTRDAPAGMTFRLGWLGWFGYELWHRTASRRVSAVPHNSAFLFVDRMLAMEHASGDAWLVTLDTGDGLAWLDSTERALGELRAAPAAAGGSTAASSAVHESGVVAWRHSDDEYVRRIDDCRRAIERGDAYQLCLTNLATVDGSFDPVAVYLRLRAMSPSHHGGLVRIGNTALLSASPELFLGVSVDGRVSTRPIKGTRRRGRTSAEDAALRDELLASDKERAENLMIVDLMRNDLSRVARMGSVRVTGLLEVESYAQVHQLVSTVQATLDDGLIGLDAVRALFPAGSMTGAPKIRAIEILDGLEDGPRGVYSGAFGYLGLDGAIELAMVIRSILITPERATVGAGGGITALSDPAEELAEMHLKAAPLLASLGAVTDEPAPAVRPITGYGCRAARLVALVARFACRRHG